MKAAQAARRLLPGDAASQTPSASRELGLGAMQVIQALSESRGRGPVCEKLSDGAFDVSRKRFFRAKGAPKDLQVFSVKPRAATA